MPTRRRASRILEAGRHGRTSRLANAGHAAPSRVNPGSPAAVLRLQQAAGNAAVTRVLDKHQGIRRDPAPAGSPSPGPAQQAPGAQAGGSTDPGWEPIYKLIAEQLGQDKIKEYAKALAGKSVDLLIAQAKDASSEKDFVAKAQLELLGTMLSAQAKKDAEAMAASPAGKAFRERLLLVSREQPELVIAAAIAAAAVAYLANPDLPELAKKFELAKGLTAEGKLDIGKLRSLTVQQASLAMKFTSEHFSAGASGAYAGEGDKKGPSGSANVSFGAKEFQFKGSLKVNPDGTVKVGLGQAIDVKNFGMETGVEVQDDKMVAIIAVKVGGKDTYVSGKTSVSADGQVSLDLGIKASDLEISGKATGLGGDKPEGEASLTGTNIFGVKGLDAKGSIKFGPAGLTTAGGKVSYATDTKNGRAFISFDAQTVAGPGKDAAPIGAQGVVGVGFSFK
jgi:hypothetical protein